MNVRVRQKERVCPYGNIQVVFIQIFAFIYNGLFSQFESNGRCFDTSEVKDTAYYNSRSSAWKMPFSLKWKWFNLGQFFFFIG